MPGQHCGTSSMADWRRDDDDDGLKGPEVMAYVVMAYIVMAYIVMAYTGMA